MSCMVIRCAGWTVVGIDPTVRSSRYWCSLALVPLAVVVYAGYKSVSSRLQTHPTMSTSLNFNLLFFFQTPPVSRNHSKTCLNIRSIPLDITTNPHSLPFITFFLQNSSSSPGSSYLRRKLSDSRN